MKIIKAFTLAEIIITMGIVGVIAAMTVPDLVSDYQNKTMAVQIRKFSNDLNEAVDLSLTDKGKNSLASTNIYSNLTDFVNDKYFSLAKSCLPEAAGCFASENYYSLDQTKNSAFKCSGNSYILSNSVAICPVIKTTETTINKPTGGKITYVTKEIQINVDINGPEPPNIGGRDMFKLSITDTGKIEDDVEYESLVGKLHCQEQPLGESCFTRLKNNNYKMDSSYY